MDIERKEYIVLDADKERRDMNSHLVNGVKKPNQRVPWFERDPDTGKYNLTDNVVVEITGVTIDGKKFDLTKVAFFRTNQVQPIPKGEHSPAFR